MKSKRNIYCEYAFWEAFFEMEGDIFRDRPKRRLWDAFYVFISQNNLFFDVDMHSIKEDTAGGRNLMELRQAKGGAGIKFIPDTFPKLANVRDEDDHILNSVFLTMSETSECDRLSKGLGMIVFNLPMIFSAKHVYEDNGISFERNNEQNWTYLLDLTEKCPGINCCNSLVLADRYLLYDSNESAIGTNLKPIFNALLPQSMDNGILFTICIIAENKNCTIGEKLNEIQNLIKELRPQLRFSLNIYDSRRLHDRSIITNNVILTSGAGFDVIGANEMPMKFTTTSLNFPFLQNDKNEQYLTWINNILKEERKCRAYQENYWGRKFKRHHLLDYYFEKPAKPRPIYSLEAKLPNMLNTYSKAE